MKFLSFFKKQQADIPSGNHIADRIKETVRETESPANKEIHESAYSSFQYTASNENYTDYKNSLYNFGFNDEKFILNTIGVILKFYYNSETQKAETLYNDLSKDFPADENVIWLNIEVICLMALPNNREFIGRYMNLKKQKHEFNFQYEVEYRKGLELKDLHYYTEAVAIFENLDKIQPFAWNNYQIAIIKNLTGKVKEVYPYLRKAIELDPAIKEDAKTYTGLKNLKDEPEFKQIIE